MLVRLMERLIGLGSLLAVASAAESGAQRSVIWVRGGGVQAHKRSKSPALMLCLEEINMGIEGGLYAEQIWNRDFEALGRHQPQWTGPQPSSVASPGLDPLERPAISGDMRPWRVVQRGGGMCKAKVTAATAPFASNPHSLLLVAVTGSKGEAGITNPGYPGGIAVPKGASFKLTLWAQASTKVQLTARLRAKPEKGAGGDGAELCSTTVNVVGTRHNLWRKYKARLPGCTDITGAAVFELVVGPGQNASLRLDGISLFPADAVAGIFNAKIVAALRALHPGFIRGPAGNMVSGTGPRTRWNWTATVGDWLSRPGHYSTSWGYWVTDGMGLLEYLILGEVLGARSILSAYSGYSMGPGMWETAGSYTLTPREAAAEALAMVNYASGTGGTKEARLRIEHGHRHAFGQPLVEIGNEEIMLDQYEKHFKAIAEATRRKFPNAQFIASGRYLPAHRGGGPDPTKVGPCVEGRHCNAVDDHFYREPDELAAMAGLYDKYNRRDPEVFIGEFAACGARCLVGGWGHKEHAMRAAIAEAAFLTGAERNGDAVRAWAFAPLISHARASQWRWTLLKYDPIKGLDAMPSYSLMRFWAKHRGHRVLPNVTVEGHAVTHASAATLHGGGVVLKLVNYSPRKGSAYASVELGHRAPNLGAPTAEVFALDTFEWDSSATGPSDSSHRLPNVQTVQLPSVGPPYDLINVPVRPWSVTMLTWKLGKSGSTSGRTPDLRSLEVGSRRMPARRLGGSKH
eukprot:TRINITY_DN4523_c0_g1_i2.p1 TRINITY_DN4523_c0_g1~~TRINITY_DN4523_c0_g1_i2.p1  ORF type:complete len:743 (+),score=150.44 TRINITY_DN4523_c0_g1_i2:40-2268(+)